MLGVVRDEIREVDRGVPGQGEPYNRLKSLDIR